MAALKDSVVLALEDACEMVLLFIANTLHNVAIKK